MLNFQLLLVFIVSLTEWINEWIHKIRLDFFFNKFLFIYLFIFGCFGSSLLCKGFLQPRRAGATLHRGARASHRRGLSRCGAQAPDAQAQQLWLTGLAAPRHVGSSPTRARTRVPCTGRQTLNHCATREALDFFIRILIIPSTVFVWHFSFSRVLTLFIASGKEGQVLYPFDKFELRHSYLWGSEG